MAWNDGTHSPRLSLSPFLPSALHFHQRGLLPWCYTRCYSPFGLIWVDALERLLRQGHAGRRGDHVPPADGKEEGGLLAHALLGGEVAAGADIVHSVADTALETLKNEDMRDIDKKGGGGGNPGAYFERAVRPAARPVQEDYGLTDPDADIEDGINVAFDDKDSEEGGEEGFEIDDKGEEEEEDKVERGPEMDTAGEDLVIGDFLRRARAGRTRTSSRHARLQRGV
ncbi:hypothetical protein D9611_009719 [Ephemerocybe angulata]|uniref:Uncharacterized protein n=1 Tax=Ephemerocybe angulata TaxID=980116 RepID=A0A8H5FG93_9AGAR|nr:hypothetical protein D9611_009719 [Tulosesus angulatus]